MTIHGWALVGQRTEQKILKQFQGASLTKKHQLRRPTGVERHHVRSIADGAVLGTEPSTFTEHMYAMCTRPRAEPLIFLKLTEFLSSFYRQGNRRCEATCAKLFLHLLLRELMTAKLQWYKNQPSKSQNTQGQRFYEAGWMQCVCVWRENKSRWGQGAGGLKASPGINSVTQPVWDGVSLNGRLAGITGLRRGSGSKWARPAGGGRMNYVCRVLTL